MTVDKVRELVNILYDASSEEHKWFDSLADENLLRVIKKAERVVYNLPFKKKADKQCEDILLGIVEQCYWMNNMKDKDEYELKLQGIKDYKVDNASVSFDLNYKIDMYGVNKIIYRNYFRKYTILI